MCPTRARRFPFLPLLALLGLCLSPNAVRAQETLLLNDSFVDGQSAGFQAGFVAGEIGAVRLVAPGPFPMMINRVQFLFGGASGTRTVTLRIWDDSTGGTTPGTELYSGDYTVTASDTALQEIDLGGENVQVGGTFRVGLEFQHSGTPSIARDGNGIGSARNFIFAQGLGWFDAAALGVTGDWIIRAVVEPVATGGGQVVQNDSFAPGQSAGFQGGFVAGETAAARLLPAGPFPLALDAVRFLFGGATGTRTVTLHVWDDPTGAATPGTELYSGDFQVTAADNALQELDLSTLGIVLGGPFRVGVEFQHDGVPSVARDGDGITAGRNFVAVMGLGWVDAAALGITGDWIIRAVVDTGTVIVPGVPDILSVADIAGDQGRSVRVRFARSDQDAPGAAVPVTSYEVYRRVDPLAKQATPSADDRMAPLLDGWDYVGATPAHGESVYSLVVPTLADSTIAAGQHWSVFLVRAATASPYIFFDSAPDSGWSVDNLAPSVPAGLQRADDTLTWQPSAAADFDYFSVYGSTSPGLDGSAVLLVRTTAASTTLPPGPSYPWYLVTASDFAGNEGQAALAAGVSAVDGPQAAARWHLDAYPNPFNPQTRVVYELATPARVELAVYALDGSLVRRLVDGQRAAGAHHETWDGRDDQGRGAAAGTYVARLRAAGTTLTRRLVLVR